MSVNTDIRHISPLRIIHVCSSFRSAYENIAQFYTVHNRNRHTLVIKASDKTENVKKLLPMPIKFHQIVMYETLFLFLSFFNDKSINCYNFYIIMFIRHNHVY